MRVRIAAALVLALAGGGALTACSTGTPLDNVVDGVIESGEDQVREQAERALGEALGGAELTRDGSLPEGFPTDAVPLVGEIRGGGAAPDGTGWAAQTVLGGIGDFDAAGTALEDVGFTANLSNADADSAFGQYSSNAYQVVLIVSEDAGELVATYVVTPA